MISGYGPKSIYAIHVPEYAKSDDIIVNKNKNQVSAHDICECTNFELESDKWFAIDEGQIVRFPLNREMEWRANKARELVNRTESDASLRADQRISMLENSANLCYFELVDLIDKIEEAKSKNESMKDLFKRIQKEYYEKHKK